MVLAGLSLVSVSLMFLLKNKTAQRVCFYVVLALIAYTVYAGLRIGIGLFSTQVVLSLVVLFTAILAFVFERVFKDDNKLFLVVRIIAAAALVLGIVNVFII
jgi:hypothetical protein